MQASTFYQPEHLASSAFSMEDHEFLSTSLDHQFDDEVLDDLFNLVEDDMQGIEGVVSSDISSDIHPEQVSSGEYTSHFTPEMADCIRPQPTPSPQPSEDCFGQEPETFEAEATAPQVPSTQEQLLAPLLEGLDGFVNVYLVVDPATDTVWVPKQIVQCKVGDVIESAEFGPFPLPSFDKTAIANFTEKVVLQPASQLKTQEIASSCTDDIFPDTISSLPSAVPSFLAERAASPETVASSESSITSSKSAKSSEPAPLKALSAYNFFFRDERERILNGGDTDFDVVHQEKLLKEHWKRDRTQKRRHRKTHGKISFTTLSRLISQRWKELDEPKKDFYREIASKDWQRYQRELNQLKAHSPSPLEGSNFLFSLVG